MAAPFVIYRRSPGEGFFSNVFCVLDNIAYARLFRWTPFIDMQRYPTRYSSPDAKNDWEAFFHQPCGDQYQIDDLLKAPYRDNGSLSNGLFTGITKGPPPRGISLTLYRALFRKWIVPRSTILQDADREMQKLELVPGNYVSVHYRGTDMLRTPGHQVSAPIESYIKIVKSIRSELGVDTVFLATDEASAIGMFRFAFGGDLVASDVSRSADGQALHYSSPGYQLGIEVLQDALIMSKGAHLVAGRSNVAIAALLLGSDKLDMSEVSPAEIYSRLKKPRKSKYLASPNRIVAFAVRSVFMYVAQQHWRLRRPG